MADHNTEVNASDTVNNTAPLFAQVAFHIIESKGISPQQAHGLTRYLQENGAVQHSAPSTDGKISLQGLTHIVSSTIDFEGYEKTQEEMLPVVTPGWIETSVLKKKLANPKSHSPDPRMFFSGLVVCIADLPPGDKDAIIGGVLAMGGLYSGAVSRLTTHIVALNMEPHACKVAVAKNLDCKLVLPHWFDDCLRLGKRIDEEPYLLPDPEVMRLRPGYQMPGAARPDLQGATSAQPDHFPSPSDFPSQERQKLSVFEDRRVMLSEDLEIGSHLRETIEDLIKCGGGILVNSVDEASTFICQYRDGENYKTASTASKDVGNLPWLYHLITHNAWTSPFRRLLHYPIARGGLPGFKKFRISLSNYSGEARIYLENLAKAAGCEFTKTMKMDNTHLITAHTMSEKCEAAKEWNINMINHLWLEESYAKWQIQSLTNPRYTHFPPRTNLSEVVGRTPIDKDALERYFFAQKPKVRADPMDIDVPEPMRDKDQNIEPTRLSESDALQPPKSSDNQGLSHRSRQPEGVTPASKKQNRRHTDAANFQTPAASRYGLGDKENETPSTTGSRSAKVRAVSALHDMAPDIALYEKERKRVGGVLFGGKRPKEEVVEVARKQSTPESDTDSDESDTRRDTKRPRKGKAPPSIRLLVTGYQKWADDPKSKNDAKARLRDLGILLTEHYHNCTYLAAPKILRTPKFLCAMARAPVLVSTQFIEDCVAKKTLMDPEKYALKDLEGEKRYRLKLPEAVRRAKANKGQLLRGQIIYCTENIYGGFDSYKSIIEMNGGRCLLYRARPGSINMEKAASPTDTDEEDISEVEREYVYLVSGHKPEEARLWPKFRQMVHGINKSPRIVKTDWMLNLALSQQICWHEEYEIMEEDIQPSA